MSREVVRVPKADGSFSLYLSDLYRLSYLLPDEGIRAQAAAGLWDGAPLFGGVSPAVFFNRKKKFHLLADSAAFHRVPIQHLLSFKLYFSRILSGELHWLVPGKNGLPARFVEPRDSGGGSLSNSVGEDADIFFKRRAVLFCPIFDYYADFAVRHPLDEPPVGIGAGARSGP